MSKFYYKKDDPTKVVTITNDSKEAFYELSNGQMIKKDVFLKYYAEQENVRENVNESFKSIKTSSDVLNPDSFFTAPSLKLNQKDIQLLKNADPEKGLKDGMPRSEIIIDTTNQTQGAVPIINERARQPLTQSKPMQESIVQAVDDTKIPIPNHTNTNVSQYKVYDNDDDAYADFVKGGNTAVPVQPPKPVQPKIEVDQLYEDEKITYGLEEAERRKNMRLKKVQTQSQPPIQQQNVEQKIQQPEMNPAETMFKTFKRNHDIKINVEFTDKIVNPEFIKLMMENMDGDIVGFYKNLILENIKNNFKVVEDEVEKQIREEIFGEGKKKVIENSGELIEKLTKLSKQLVDKSDEITINDGMDDDLVETILEKKDELTKLSEELVEKSNILTEKLDKLDNLDEEISKHLGDVSGLIPSGTTPGGKQLYWYLDENGKAKEVLPNTAKRNGWKPLTKEEE